MLIVNTNQHLNNNTQKRSGRMAWFLVYHEARRMPRTGGWFHSEDRVDLDVENPRNHKTAERKAKRKIKEIMRELRRNEKETDKLKFTLIWEEEMYL